MSGSASAQERLAGLSREQRALLFEQIRRRKERTRMPSDRIPRRPPDLDPLPLSFAQERLWFIDRLEPGLATYNMPLALRIEGEASPAVLAAILGEVVRRHESLRTTFREARGRPVQVIAPPGPWTLPFVDLTALPEPGRAAETRRLAREESVRPFDLGRGPLLRATLLRLASADHVLLLSMHHIVSDGWSLGVFVREITALYGAALSGTIGTASPLPELPIQYADFAVWQRECLREDLLEGQLAYWRERLEGVPASLALPTDRPRSAGTSSGGAQMRVVFGSDVARGLARLARRHEASLYMVLLAGFQALLGRLSGQEDLAVGSPIANRHRTEVESLIGFFVNTLVLRGDLRGDPSFEDLVDRVRRTTLEAYAHQDLPFERLVEELRPERHLASNPLVQVVFAMQNAPIGRMELPGLALSPLPFEVTTALFDLELDVWETEEGALLAVFSHNSDLLDRTTVLRIAGYLETLLREAAAVPERRLSALRMLDAAQCHQLLAEWNDTAAELPREDLASLFAEQVRRRAGAVAVSHAGGELTYGELDRRSSRLARRLAVMGVGPEARVALLARRSPALVVGILGIVKAAGAYVPLDPSYPEDRLAWMLSDCGAEVLLAEPGLLPPGLSLPAGIELMELSADPPATNGPQPVAPMADALAYVMYTSGSTGRPKGVGVTHRNIVRLVREGGFADLGPDQVFLQLAPISFDASTLELWAPLLNGGRLAVMPPHQPSLAELGEAISRFGVTSLWLTAGLFHQMVDDGLEALRPLRQLLAGGDVLSPPHVRRALYGLPDTILINGYGPTEVTTFTCCFPMTPSGSSEPPEATVPIGRPIGNTRVHVLGPALRPVPCGVWGELCAAGDGVSRGYLGNPELTAERFVPDPFAAPGGEGERLYRTGDIVRFLADGRIEFLGRRDEQVKLRGFRVEPREIESALVRHPGVAEAAVVAREAAPAGGKRLVAYVVPCKIEPQAEPAAALVPELRRALHAELPDHMVPAAFVLLDSLPLTAHGKVDRAALPAPPEVTGAAETTPPRTPVETALAEIWREVLGVERVGIEDDFFELGGHSLLATQLVSRLRAAFDLEVPLRIVFEQPRLGELAAAIEVRRSQDGAAGTEIPRREPGLLAIPLSYAQERLWFFDRLQPGSPAYHNPSALLIRGPLDGAALEAALDGVTRRHEGLRTVFRDAGGQPVQVILPPERRTLPVTDLSALPERRRGAEARRLAFEEGQRPFDLASGPLLRAHLLRFGTEEHCLLFVMHHIISDGWSLGVLVAEVGELYGAARAGVVPSLPELPIQYADFAVWQRRWLHSDVLERQLAYWRRQLAGAPATIELPVDKPRPAVQSFHGTWASFVLSPELKESLRLRARRHDATLFMTLLAGLQALLGRYSRQEDFLIGSPIANRDRPETAPLIGFLVNTLVLRADLAGEPTFEELLGRVRHTALDGYSHQDVPFERLVEELRPERHLSHNPLFQVLLALHTVPGEAAFPGLAISTFDFEVPTARLDLELSFTEVGRELRLQVIGRTDLFEPATMRRLAEHLERLLTAAAADPRRAISDLPLAGDSERHQLLREWNDGVEMESGPDIVERFETWASSAPEAPAVLAGGESISYGELNRSANRLAHRLRRLGVGPGATVGLFMERSTAMVAGLLGIWKAGGAYVPLDPGLPPARLAFLLEDSGVPVIVTEERSSAALPRHGARTVLLGDPELAGESESDPEPLGGPQNPAYLIYTSGTTGQPKAVVVERRHLENTLAATRRLFGFEAADRMPCVAPFSFDVFLFELLSPLLAGGVSQLVPLRPTLDVETLVDALSEATLLHAVPALMRQVVEAVRRRPEPPRLRALFVGGDVVPADLVADLRKIFPQARIWILYGPTEAAILATAGPVPSAGPARPLLGRPLDGVTIDLRDRVERLVPPGVPGEIWIGGPGGARGYLGRDELTAERFVTRDGRRFFRSGDLARRLAAGELEFLGRLDSQVKIRGFRIELGEIESALGRHPRVSAAVVAVHAEDAGGSGEGRRLVAYVVPRERGETDSLIGELRRGLQAELPDYMVPAAFVLLDSLPLTVHGKVDREALPAPEPRRASGSPPRTPAEILLAGIWRELLGIEQVGVEDNFFELGGHSLLATQLVSQIRSACRVEIPLRGVFETPTLGGLAAALAAAGAEGAAEGEEIRVAPAREAPLSFSQERLWFLDRLLPGSSIYNMPSPLRLRGPLHPEVLERCFAEIMRRHETLRTRFEEREGTAVQVVDPPGPVLLPRVDLSGLPAAERRREAERITAEEAFLPFDLERGPVIRFALLRLGEMTPDEERPEEQPQEEHALLMTIHHIVSDGWSVGVLSGELTRLYAAFAAGGPSPLPDLPVQYADFARWQRAWLSGPQLDSQLAYWRECLAGHPPGLDLPRDRPRSAVQTFRGGAAPLRLPRDLSDRLKSLALAERSSAFMVLLAGFDVLLQRLSGQHDILVGTPVAGRTRPEIEGLIGFFLNTLVLRVDLSGRPSFRELVRRVRAAALGAYTNQEIPFEKLLAELQPERDLSRTPLFEVFFNMLNLPPSGAKLPGGLAVEALSFGQVEAKFDLTVYASEGEDGFVFNFVYNADLFDHGRVEEMLRQYRSLLSQAAEEPDRPIDALSLLTPEAAALLPDPTVALGEESPGLVHELFADQARRRPERIALVDAEGMWTYGDLHAAVRRLAGWLRTEGVGPGDCVAIHAHRSAPVVWAVLGVLEAGAAFVVLDPAYPAARLAAMVELAGPRAWLEVAAAGPPGPELEALLQDLAASGRLACRLALPGGGPDGARPLLQSLPAATGEPPAVAPDDVALIAFTSGSTGVPKGIVGRHGPLTHFLPWLRERFALGAEDRYSMLSGLSHDPLQRDMFTPLCTGAILCVPPTELIGAPGRLAEWMAREGITVAHLTPAMGQLLTELSGGGAEPPQVPSLRWVLLVGDILTRLDVDRIRSIAPRVTCVNLYGSTESQRAVGYHLVEVAEPEAPAGGERAQQGLPLGRGIKDVQLLVLDPQGRLAGIGEVGEICIRSPHLARGYLGDETLSRERFQENPFRRQPGDRIYRTGDLGRYLPNGEAVFAGRADQQVKIRGFRIELGEIEAVLGRQPGVREAVVVVRENPALPGDRRLVAYVVPDPERPADPGAVHEALRRRLPAYMIPSAFVVMERLPLLPNGKVDRRSLPQPDADGREHVPPSTPTEEALAEIWRSLMGVEQVGADDDFFRLGGHSLLATRVAARARDAFGIELPLPVLFQETTLAQLAAWIDRERAERSGPALPKIQARRRGARAAELLSRVEGLSDEEVQELLRRRKAGLEEGSR